MQKLFNPLKNTTFIFWIERDGKGMNAQCPHCEFELLELHATGACS